MKRTLDNGQIRIVYALLALAVISALGNLHIGNYGMSALVSLAGISVAYYFHKNREELMNHAQ